MERSGEVTPAEGRSWTPHPSGVGRPSLVVQYTPRVVQSLREDPALTTAEILRRLRLVGASPAAPARERVGGGPARRPAGASPASHHRRPPSPAALRASQASVCRERDHPSGPEPARRGPAAAFWTLWGRAAPGRPPLAPEYRRAPACVGLGHRASGW